jgi:predicted phosphodiesterase
MNKNGKTEIAREYRLKYGMEMPTKKLARIMYEENNLLFVDTEDARQLLRYIEGKHGNNSSKFIQKSEFYMQNDRPKNPYNLPEADEEPYEPYVLKGYNRVAIFSDIHVPYHSVEAITIALEYTKQEKPDLLLLNGDTLDMYALSRFDKDPSKRHFAGELEMMGQLLEVFRKELDCEILFKIGNHEERYEHFLFSKAKELVGVEEFKLENILKKRMGNDVQIVGDKRIIHANSLNIIHGHEFSQGFFSPVNVARGLALRAKASAIQGHNHQTSEHTSVDINGKVMTTWSVGALCQLRPKYMPINNWNYGMAIVDLDSNGTDFQVRNKRIFGGKML